MHVFEVRASTIIYNFLVGLKEVKPFLLPANICPVVPLTFIKAGYPFEFVDISPATLNMDNAVVLEKISLQPNYYGGVLYAHTYGDQTSNERSFSLIKKLDSTLVIIDDRCLCTPEFGSPSNSSADIILFSTGYAKIVDLGFGGFAWLNDSIKYQPNELSYQSQAYVEIMKNIKQSLQNHAPYFYEDSPWLDTRTPQIIWDEYQALVTKQLESTLLHRNQINEIYKSLLPIEWQLPPSYQLWRFNIRISNSVTILKTLFSNNLFASNHYASLGGIFSPHRFIHAEKLANECINLFNDNHYTPEMAERSAQLILKNAIPLTKE